MKENRPQDSSIVIAAEKSLQDLQHIYRKAVKKGDLRAALSIKKLQIEEKRKLEEQIKHEASMVELDKEDEEYGELFEEQEDEEEEAEE